MTAITQTIPNYVLGMSDQPDQLKTPGQVRNLINCVPDITEMLFKRPASEFIGNIGEVNATTDASQGHWFDIYNNKFEQYMGVVRRGGDVQVWRLVNSTDSFLTITDAGASLTNGTFFGVAAAATSGVGINMTADITVVGNVATRILINTQGRDYLTYDTVDFTMAVDGGGTDTVTARFYGTNPYTSVTTRSTGLTNGELTNQATTNITGTGTGLTVNTLVRDGELVRATINTIGTGYNRGDTFSVDGMAGTVVTFFNGLAGEECPVVHEDDETTAPFFFPASVPDTYAPRAIRANTPYLTHAEDTDIRDLTVNNYTFFTNRTANPIMTTGTGAADLSPAATNVGWVSLVQLANEKEYQVNVSVNGGTATPLTHTAGTGTLDADAILDGLIADLPTGFTATKVGNGFQINGGANEFTLDSTAPALIQCFTDTVQNIALLPTQCVHGYKVEIANSENTDDNYFVEFVGRNDQNGVGVWEETVGFNTRLTINDHTMPHQMVRMTDGTFVVQPINYESRLVGDDTSNPPPSFIGGYTPTNVEDPQERPNATINNIVLFRNRLGFLSGQNVILSKPGDFFNFFNTTALTTTPDDPIDISASATQPAILFGALETNVGLNLFSRTQQFMLTTDNDILAPNTAKINYIAAYDFNEQTDPFSLGTTVGFVNGDAVASRFYEMEQQRREGEPQVIEQSKIISHSFPPNINHVSGSRDEQFVLFSVNKHNTLFGYKYYQTGQERLQGAWFRWILQGNSYHHCIHNDVIYIVMQNGEQLTTQKIDLKVDDGTITYPYGGQGRFPYHVYLDCKSQIPFTDLTYTAADDDTTFTLPYTSNSANQTMYVFTLTDGQNQGRIVELGTAATDPNRIVGQTVTLKGDWRNGLDAQGNAIRTDLFVGYEFEMKVDFPTIYPTKASGKGTTSDWRSSLIIHRVKFDLGVNQAFDVEIRRTGKSDFTQTYEARMNNAYPANQVAFLPTRIVTMPCYERNQTLNITLKTSYPTGFILNSMTWEGDYNNKYYQSV